jgi:hypothetical protein
MTALSTTRAMRCAVHPSRRAADSCPVCDRPRCGADAARYQASGCAACVVLTAPRPSAPRTERLLRAALAALAVGFVGAWVAAQYVDTQWFGVLAPALVGLACAWAASAAAGRPHPGSVLVVAAVTGVLATALSDRLVPGGQNLFLPPSHRLPPYLAAVIGALAWPVLFPPPKPPR